MLNNPSMAVGIHLTTRGNPNQQRFCLAQGKIQDFHLITTDRTHSNFLGGYTVNHSKEH